MTRSRAGFTLVELMIAVSLAGLVLLAIVGVASSMVKFHMDGIRSGSITGGSVVSFVQMSREIESANVLVYPGGGVVNADVLVGCNNWSRVMGGRLDPNPLSNAEVFYFCFNPATRMLWRYFISGPAVACPATPPLIPACDGNPFGVFGAGQVLATDVERLGGQTMFTRDDGIGGVRIHYVVGEQAQTAGRPVPQFIPLEASLSMQKAYGNIAD